MPVAKEKGYTPEYVVEMKDYDKKPGHVKVKCYLMVYGDIKKRKVSIEYVDGAYYMIFTA